MFFPECLSGNFKNKHASTKDPRTDVERGRFVIINGHPLWERNTENLASSTDSSCIRSWIRLKVLHFPPPRILQAKFLEPQELPNFPD